MWKGRYELPVMNSFIHSSYRTHKSNARYHRKAPCDDQLPCVYIRQNGRLSVHRDWRGRSCGRDLHSEETVPQDEINQRRFQFRTTPLRTANSYHPITETLYQISVNKLRYHQFG